MTDDAATRRFGGPIGWLEHEIDHHNQNLIRAGRGLPPLPPPEMPSHPVILREAEVKRRTGISRVMRWKLERAGRFPRRVSLDSFGRSADGVADAA